MNSITQLCLLIEKYKEELKTSVSYCRYQVLKDVVEDLEQLKELLEKDTK